VTKSETEEQVLFLPTSNNDNKNILKDQTVSDQALIEEIERLKKYMRHLEDENESLCQQLEKQNLNQIYNSEINNLIVNSCDYSGEFQV